MDFKKFFLNPITITVGIILTLGILALVGYNYWGWFGGKTKKPLGANVPSFPKNPKEGDKFTYKGVDYTYSCIQPECLLPPCPPMCDWKITSNTTTHRIINQEKSSSQNSSDKFAPEVYDLLPSYNTARATQSDVRFVVCSHKVFPQYFTSNHNDDATTIKYDVTWYGSDCNDAKLLQAIDITNKYLSSIETACNRPSHVVAELVGRIQNVVKLPINFKGQLTIYCNPCFNGLGAKLFCD